MKNLIFGALGIGLLIVILWFLGNAFLSNGGWSGLVQDLTLPQYSSLPPEIFDTTRQIEKMYGTGQPTPLVTVDELGAFSGARGLVTITRESTPAESATPAEEHFILHADAQNTAPINITGWTLESMVSGKSAVIPQGVAQYQMGTVNNLGDIYLAPGESAIITTGSSPVGVSFHANSCTGFLNTQKGFYPELDEVCINPATIMAPTLENIKQYGDTCIDFARHFPSCRYLTSDIPAVQDLTSACIEKLRPELSYTNCVNTSQNDASFINGYEWRIFLGSATELWKDHYEVIRLTDTDGKTVDAYLY